MINPWIAGIALAGAIGAFLFGFSVGGDRAEAKAARTGALIDAAREAAQAGAAAEIAKIKIVNQTHRQVLEREIVKEPVYTDCRHSPDGLRVVNGALEGRPVPADRGVVPGPDAP